MEDILHCWNLLPPDLDACYPFNLLYFGIFSVVTREYADPALFALPVRPIR